MRRQMPGQLNGNESWCFGMSIKTDSTNTTKTSHGKMRFTKKSLRASEDESTSELVREDERGDDQKEQQLARAYAEHQPLTVADARATFAASRSDRAAAPAARSKSPSLAA